MGSSVKRTRRDSRNIAIALALFAFAVVVYFVTIVKFDDQIRRNEVSQTRAGESVAADPA